MSQQSSPLPTLTPLPEYRSPILQPNFLLNFPVPYQSLNNPFCSSQRASHEAWSNHDEPNLTDAIHDFAQTVQENQGSGNGFKVQELDVFDGSDTKKLWAFPIQCQLNFNSKPWVFQTNASKVNYVISYLKGTTLDWFESGLMSDNPLDWISNYSKFTSELKHNFGPHNPKGDVENELKALWMKDNQWMVKYLVDFNCLAAQVTWGDSALQHQLYKGLLNQIKDEVSQIGKPSTLSGMCQLIQQINMCYWECQSEISWESKNPIISPANKSPTSPPIPYCLCQKINPPTTNLPLLLIRGPIPTCLVHPDKTRNPTSPVNSEMMANSPLRNMLTNLPTTLHVLQRHWTQGKWMSEKHLFHFQSKGLSS